MDFDDESDLTSLEDEEEQQADDAGARDLKGMQQESESSLTSEDEDTLETSQINIQNGTGKATTTPLSPLRVGSSLTRPAPVAGLRTYGRKRERPGRRFKEESRPRASQSPEPASTESPLSSLPSPSPRKRRASALTQQPPSTPSKRRRRKNGLAKDVVHELEKSPVSSRKRATNGHDSRLDPPLLSMKAEKNGKNVSQAKAPESSVSVGRRKRGRPPSKKKLFKRNGLEPRNWSLETIGSLVWVRVDRKNVIVDDDSYESFWWPAMRETTVDRQEVLQVRLLFPPFGSSTSIPVTVRNPSSSNIMSYKDRSYTVNSFWSLSSSSVRSQPAGYEDLKIRWESACKKIVEEDLRLHDGFPTSLTALLSQPLGIIDDAQDDSASRAGSPEQAVTSLSSISEDECWSPPPPEPNIAIPGELVLSTTKTKGFVGKFYPAKVIAYLPPSSRTIPPKYTVHFMDNFHEDVTRDMFYVYEQDEFGTCRLGQFESLESLEEKDGEDGLLEDVSEETGDSVVFTDPPLLPAPPPEKFCELSIMEQTPYIIPILTKVVENRYRPAEARISAFLNGGRERAKMSKEAIAKGLLTYAELKELAGIIKSWALHMDSSSNEMRDVNDSHQTESMDVKEQVSRLREPDPPQATVSAPSSHLVKEPREASDNEPPPSLSPSSLPPPPPPSSLLDEPLTSSPNGVSGGDQDTFVAESANEAKPLPEDRPTINGVQPITTPQPTPPTKRSFKDLLRHEKIHFCTDVLLKEGVIQLLLWRVGKRRSPELLSETEELLLHETGSNLAGEFDIARIVKDLRSRKEKYLEARKGSSKQYLSTGGTRSRPRKV